MTLFASDEENGCCYCLIEPDGERTLPLRARREYRFQAQWLSRLDLDPFDWLYLCGIDLEEAQNECLVRFASASDCA